MLYYTSTKYTYITMVADSFKAVAVPYLQSKLCAT